MDQFTLILPSNAKNYNNSVAGWKTKLASRTSLPGKWVVGLKEISYPKSWYNVTTKADVTLLTLADSDPDETMKAEDLNETLDMDDSDSDTQESVIRDIIPMGYYSSTEQIANALNKGIIKNLIENGVATSFTPRVKFLPYSNKIRFIAGLPHKDSSYEQSTTFWFSDEFNELIGFNRNAGWKNELVEGPDGKALKEMLVKDSEKPFDLLGGIRGVYVYTNIVKPVQIGDTYSPLLRVVEVPPVSFPFGEQFTKRYDHPVYTQVSTNMLDEIEFELCDDTGKPIPFMFGKGHIMLDFKQISS